MDPFFEMKVKQAFSKVKGDISLLKQEITGFKALINELISKIENSKKVDNSTVNNQNNKSSTGNKGVYAFTHSFIHSPFTHLNTHSSTHSQDFITQPSLSSVYPPDNSQNTDKNNILYNLQTLTNKEFLVFLTIYQLEKELSRITYNDIAKKLTLTSGCIRSYITSLIRKKAPLIKSKLNNKITILSIDASFRSLTSEQKLINLYYQNDPHQATLF